MILRHYRMLVLIIYCLILVGPCLSAGPVTPNPLDNPAAVEDSTVPDHKEVDSTPKADPKSEKEDAEALLLTSVKPGDDEKPPMYLEEDPGFTWQELVSRDKENAIFTEGETLEYEVSWMGINAGNITMQLFVDAKHDDKPVHKVVVVGKTNKTFSIFFKVNDVITSWFNKETFNSEHYIKDVREGSYRKFKETSYDQDNRIAHVRDQKYELPPNSKDPIASMYALRRYPVNTGDVIRLNSNSEGKSNFPVAIKFGELDEISLDDDIKRKTIIGNPIPSWEGRVFEKNQSKVKMWITHDEYNVPLILETKVRIGTMKAELIRRTGPGWELNLKKD